MLGSFNIQSTAEQMLASGPVLEKEKVSLEDGVVDTRPGVLVVLGDGYPGATIGGSGTVLLRGSLRGNERQHCHIEVDGDVVVLGEVVHSEIRARRVYVGASAQKARLYAREGVEVGGYLIDARIYIGNYEPEYRAIEAMKERVARTVQEQELVERQLKMEQKRVDNLFKTTRIRMASVGQIVQLKRNRIVIDLGPLYRTLSGRSEEDVDRALREFFAKAIVGALARGNRQFLAGNAHRQRILKGAIGDVNTLFSLTHEFDKIGDRIGRFAKEVVRMGQALAGRSCSLYVRGGIRPQLEARFTTADVEQTETGDVLIHGETARLIVRPKGDVELGVTRIDPGGDADVQDVSAGEFEQCEIRMQEGQVIWQPIETEAALSPS